jgi:microcystin-dependent protein
MPAHNPSTTDPGHGHNVGNVDDGGGSIAEVNGRVQVWTAGSTASRGIATTNSGFGVGLIAKGATTGITSSVAAAAASAAHENMPPYVVVNKIIKAL